MLSRRDHWKAQVNNQYIALCQNSFDYVILLLWFRFNDTGGTDNYLKYKIWKTYNISHHITVLLCAPCILTRRARYPRALLVPS